MAKELNIFIPKEHKGRIAFVLYNGCACQTQITRSPVSGTHNIVINILWFPFGPRKKGVGEAGFKGLYVPKKLPKLKNTQVVILISGLFSGKTKKISSFYRHVVFIWYVSTWTSINQPQNTTVKQLCFLNDPV